MLQVGRDCSVVYSAKFLHDPAPHAQHLGTHPDVALPLLTRSHARIVAMLRDIVRRAIAISRHIESAARRKLIAGSS